MGLRGPKCSSLCSIACCICMETHVMMEEHECARGEGGSHQPDKMETPVGAPQQWHRVGYGTVKMGGRRGRERVKP